MTQPASGPENRLAQETSPYLLQHRHNPVDWWPWGPAALAEAERTGKPILLSVGYAACHWCHVMAHESFEDAATAQVMNALFVNVKVDREERPDIDQIYMSALHHLGEQGGWPLTMFLTPAGEPVWGGTYFPKTSRYGKPAFVDVLREIARLFREEPDKIAQNRSALMQRLSEVARPQGRMVVGAKELDQFAMQVAGLIDTRDGGIRGAPKFPQCALFEFLWRAGERPNDLWVMPRDGSAQRQVERGNFRDLVALTLERICQGGIYDHLGGGFARYSVDERWLVPHFEKMLYDNAQLLELLTVAFLKTGRPLFARRARETVGWLAREMTTPEGAFCASLDADSEGEEGKFYVWSLAEIRAVLGEENAAVFAAEYDVSEGGNFEGHNIVNKLNSLENGPEIEARMAMLRSMLQQKREERVRPGLDDKVLADWNGLMIAALAQASLPFEEPGWLGMARRAFAFIVTAMTRDDRLGHSWREDRLLFPGLASDFAAMIKAALALYEVTGEAGYLTQAIAWQAAFDRHYANRLNGGYFLTADDAEGLVVRPASTADDAIPNPNAIAAQNLIRLAALTGDAGWRERADALIEGVLAAAGNNLFAQLGLLNAVDMRIGLAEVVVVGTGAEALVQAALRLPFLSRSVLRAPDPGAVPPTHPAQDKIRAAAGPAAFICSGESWSLPVTTPDALAQTYAAAQSR
ncbi:MAG: thioredoxin domain-containing protein [Pseudorhodoplanes sp.]